MKHDSQLITLLEIKGLINTLWDRLTGPDAHTWLQAFKQFLRKENPWTDRIINLWRSVVVGGSTAERLMDESIEKGFKLGIDAEYMTKSDQFEGSIKPKKVDFVKKLLKEYGFTGTTFGELLEFFRNHPLYQLCESEDVYYLRATYTDQPKDEQVRLAMETIINSDGATSIFVLDHNAEGLCIRDNSYYSTDKVNLYYFWVARIRK
ncbi:MAG: hypothetical protein K9M36_02660 [Candidatus Pacebacteria bacterium]|nr:hypothetical protein [Candidatus Paceibacterota bacterium]